MLYEDEHVLGKFKIHTMCFCKKHGIQTQLWFVYKKTPQGAFS